MARLQILYHPEVARRDIPSLDPPVRRRIKAAIEQRLTTHPEDFAKPLAYNKAGLWSLRAGPWRVIFALRGEELGAADRSSERGLRRLGQGSP